ncbi:MAG: pilus assembly protein [Proteobacteria bacterium]|jgi:Flp pilus assembly protein TadG|nr:MAG: pilus assembly protein [Pseudomonadota bacterium]
MYLVSPVRSVSQQRSVGLARSWARDERGTTAIEFALVGLPFFMFLFGIFGLGLYFFTTFSLESAVEQASRLIRVGFVQESGMTAEEFKQEVCKRLPAFVDCDGKMRVNVQSYSDFASIIPPACTDTEGNLVPPHGTSYNTGGASEVVLVTICYEWDMAGLLPFLKLGNMPSGAALIQASATFRTEPYGD